MTNDPANLIAISWDPEYVDYSSLETGGMYYYAVTGVSPNSIEGIESPLASFVAVNTSVETHPVSPVLSLSAYPNPTNQPVTIELELGEASAVSFRIFDVLGRQLKQLGGNASIQTPGRLEQVWNLDTDTMSRVPSGVYFLVVSTGKSQKTIPIHVSR